MDPLAIGLVGCGGMGRRHLRAYAALAGVGPGEFDLAAVCDPRPDAAEQAAELAEELLGTRPQVFTAHEELIASGIVEALDVVTDPAAHHLVAVPALARGSTSPARSRSGSPSGPARRSSTRSGRARAATAENYRRDGPNRLRAACSTRGCSGTLHAWSETNIGGSDEVLISPVAPHPRVRSRSPWTWACTTWTSSTTSSAT